MSDRVYKLTDIVGSSAVSVEDAISNAVRAASSSIEHVEWFQVEEVRGHVNDGEVGHYQVVLKVGFRLRED